MTAASSKESEDAMAASVRVRAALRRSERFQWQYRLPGRESLALVSVLEGICTDLGCRGAELGDIGGDRGGAVDARNQ
eukprot:11226804-Alexandrium_andersonii.AAC.1